MMKNLNRKTVGQIVAADYRTAEVFREFGLDFCCGGNKTIAEASANNEINPKEVEKALQNIGGEDTQHHHYNKWSLDFLVDYIINNHHTYSRKVLPEINFYAKKVLSAHGKNHPELEEMYYELAKLYAEMIQHLDEEETVLFPYIKKLTKAPKSNVMPRCTDFGLAVHPISMMEEEHKEAGKGMAKISHLSNNFSLPDDACATYRVLFENLQAFQKDLHKHVHLENNILFPKALKLEQKLNSNSDL